jgi:tRNA-splicing endonuclease subunit Sen54
VIARGACRFYEAIYSRLSLIPSHHPHTQSTPSVTGTARSPFRIVQSLEATTHLKKPDPPPADFLVAAVRARETSLPTLPQLSALFDSVSVGAKAAGKNQFQHLKDGYRNAIIAVADSGVTSFIKFADVGFSDGLMYKWKPPGRGGGRVGGIFGGRGQGSRSRER